MGCVHFLVYLQDYIAGRSIIDAHFGRHHHHVILSDVEARWAQAVSAKQKFKKVFCITTSVPCVIINCDYILVCFLALPPSWHPLIYIHAHTRTHIQLAESLAVSQRRGAAHTHVSLVRLLQLPFSVHIDYSTGTGYE